MAHPNASPHYDPLPLTGEDHNPGLYNTPGSPMHSNNPYSSSPGTPDMGSSSNLPTGAAQPRFLAGHMYNDNPELRASIASASTFPMDRGSEYNGSVLALNEQGRMSAFDNEHYHDDPNNMPMSPIGTPTGRGQYLEEKHAEYASPRSRRKVIIGAIVVAIILVILAVIIPVYFAVIKPNKATSSGDSNGGSLTTTASDGSVTTIPAGNLVKTGGDGSEITMEDGKKFTYSNKFGGTWYYDPSDPYNNAARAQSWSPALNETFEFGVQKIRGSELSHTCSAVDAHIMILQS